MGSEPSFSQHLPKEFTNHSKEVVMNKKKLATAGLLHLRSNFQTKIKVD